MLTLDFCPHPTKKDRSHYYIHYLSASWPFTIHFFPQLEPCGRSWKQLNREQNKNKHSKERKSAYGKKKKPSMRGYPNIFQLCLFQVCGGFITTTWDCNNPKETGESCPRALMKKKPLLMALEVTPRSTQADLLMRGWCHDQEVSSDDVRLYTNDCVCVLERVNACCGCVSVSFGGGGRQMMCLFVSVLVRWQHTDTLCVCGVQEVKKSLSRGGVSEDRTP